MNRPHPPRCADWLRLAAAGWLVVVLLASGALGRAAEPAREGTPRQSVLAQKARLIEQLLGSPKVRELEAGADAQAKTTLARVRVLLAEARSAAEDSDSEAKLNEALRLATQVTRARPGNLATDEDQVRRNTALRDQIAVYRTALVTSAQARGLALPPALATLDRHLADAQVLSSGARHADAGKALSEAYRIAVESLVALRAGETVTIELKFETPADEFAYELKRYQSHEQLVEMTLDERRPTGTVRATMDQYTQQARALRTRAAESASAGDHRAGIKSLEDATRLLLRALQAAGMPVY